MRSLTQRKLSRSEEVFRFDSDSGEDSDEDSDEDEENVDEEEDERWNSRLGWR